MNTKESIYKLALIVFWLCYTSGASALTWHKANTPADTNNVIALWHFDDTQTSVLVSDSGTNNYNLALNNTGGWASGGSWNSSSNTGYLSVDTNYYAHTNTYIDVEWTNDLTISFWMRGDSTMMNGTYTTFYLGKNATWGNRSKSNLDFRPGWSNPFRPGMRDISTNLTVGTFKDDTWHHVGMIYDYHANGTDSLVYIYWDNELKNTYTNNNASDENLNMWIGRSQDDNSPRRWDGDIDEFFLYSGIITNFSDGYPAAATAPGSDSTPMSTIYETEFDSMDVTNDWNIADMTVYTDVYSNDTGRITANQGWEDRRHATLSDAESRNLSNVTVTAKQLCRSGNANTYTEVAARTSNSTNGIFIRVYGNNGSADVYLYDGSTNTVLDSMVSSDINSKHEFYDVILAISSNSVSATVSNSLDCVTLSGTIANSLASGDIRIAGYDMNVSSESGRPATFYLKVEVPFRDSSTIFIFK